MTKSKEGPKLLSVSAFAKLAGVDESTIRKAPRNRVRIRQDGRVAECELQRWNRTRDPAKVRRQSGEVRVAEDFQRARSRKAIADAALAERELAKSEGELVSRAEVQRGLAAFARLQSAKWTAFASRYGQEIWAEAAGDQKKFLGTLERFVRLQLEEISAAKPILPG